MGDLKNWQKLALWAADRFPKNKLSQDLAYKIISDPQVGYQAGATTKDVTRNVFSSKPKEEDTNKYMFVYGADTRRPETTIGQAYDWSEDIRENGYENVKTYSGVLNPYNEYLVDSRNKGLVEEFAKVGYSPVSNINNEYIDWNTYRLKQGTPYFDDVHGYRPTFHFNNGKPVISSSDLYDFGKNYIGDFTDLYVERSGNEKDPAFTMELQRRALNSVGQPYLLVQKNIPIRFVDNPQGNEIWRTNNFNKELRLDEMSDREISDILHTGYIEPSKVTAYKKGGRIHIKKKNRGSFTRWCKGKVTEECIRRGKNSSNPAIRKKATFAANARKWKHENGGILKYQNPATILDLPEGSEYGGELEPAVVKPAPLYGVLNTYYPVISKFPLTGHSELQVVDFGWDKPLTISKYGTDYDYNLVTNNCSDATRCAVEKIFGEKINPVLFTTPGDVQDFVAEKTGQKPVKEDVGQTALGFNIPFATAMDLKNQNIDFYIQDYLHKAAKMKKQMKEENPNWNSASFDLSTAEVIQRYKDQKYKFQPFKNKNGGILKAQNGTGNLYAPHPLSPVGIALNQARAMAKGKKDQQHFPSGVKEVVGPDGKKVAIRTEQPLVPLEQSIAEWLPGTGDVAEVGYIANDVKNGNLGSAALATAMVALPGNVGKIFRKSDVPTSKLTEAERLGIPKSQRSNPKALDNPQYWGYEQWNERYNAAVRAGNWEEAQRLRDLHFMSKAPNTKIIDEKGMPRHMYHGVEHTTLKGKPYRFTKYRGVNWDLEELVESGDVRNHWRLSKPNDLRMTSYHTPSYRKAFGYGQHNPTLVHDDYLNITNPFTWDEEKIHQILLNAGRKSEKIPYKERGRFKERIVKDENGKIMRDKFGEPIYEKGEWIPEKSGFTYPQVSDWANFADDSKEELMKLGYDGLYIPQYYNSYGAFISPSQFKSADPITWDGKGEIIPIVKRDNFRNLDSRYQKGGKL